MPIESRTLLAVGLFGQSSRWGDRIESLLQRGRDFSIGVSIGRVSATLALSLALSGVALRVPNMVAFAQSQEFEVASIKPNDGAAHGRFIRPSGDRLIVTNMTVKNLLTIAFGVRDFQLSGGPAWIASEGYDIEAKSDSRTTPKQMEGPMLQALLRSRFKLRTHYDTRESPVYVLSAMNGSKLKPSGEKNCVPFDPANPPLPSASGSDPSKQCGFLGLGRGSLNARQVTMESLAMALSQLLGRTVLDRTGITGELDARLTFAPLDSSDPTLPPVDPSLPSIFTALQEQLGLKLESSKGPVNVLVIDHVEKPDAN